MFLQWYHRRSQLFLCQWIWARWHPMFSSRWWVCYAYFTWSRFYSPPPLLACIKILKMKTKLLRETIYQLIIIIFSYILIILWYNKLLFFRTIDREDIFLGGCLPGLVTISVRPRRKLYPQTYSQLTRGTLHQDCRFWPQKTTCVLGKKSFKIECRWRKLALWMISN